LYSAAQVQSELDELHAPSVVISTKSIAAKRMLET